MAPRLRVSRPGLATLTERPNHGNEDPREVRLLGAHATKTATNMMEVIAALVAWAALQAALLLGRVTAGNAILIVTGVIATTAANSTMVATAVLLPLVLRRGIRLLLHLPERSLTEATPVQVVIQDTQRCLLLLVLEDRPHHRLLTT